MPYPWLQAITDSVAGALAHDRMPHALLLAGQPGVGKSMLADYVARQLLCPDLSAGGAPCGLCAGCLQYAAGTHPDFFRVEPAEDATVIKVDQIRELAEKLSLSSHHGGFKVALLAPAESMNINAANSLLKTLEEPSDNTVLLLVSARPAQLPATIRSRCQLVRVEMPARDVALGWLTGQVADDQKDVYLKLAHGAPLEALRQARADLIRLRRERFESLLGILDGSRSALAVAQEWSKDEDLEGIRWLREWLMDLLRIRLTGQTGSVRSADLEAGLEGLARRLESRVLFGLLDSINRLLRLTAGSLNRQLLTEDILLAWATQCRSGR
ncbi:MAG TPA: DNA polymerase III subunit delta' [Gammaproteobacteria bacterium]|nr:DNA polymerase III subunit delta' [Gammaproteobacteria bacterium]